MGGCTARLGNASFGLEKGRMQVHSEVSVARGGQGRYGR